MTPPGTLAAEAPRGAQHLDPRVHALRSVHRAVAELRRGTPVLLQAGDTCLVVAAAETVGARGLSELAAAALAPALLLLAPVRAAAVLQRPVPHAAEEEGAVALRLPQSLMAPEALRSLADPTAERLILDTPERLPRRRWRRPRSGWPSSRGCCPPWSPPRRPRPPPRGCRC